MSSWKTKVHALVMGSDNGLAPSARSIIWQAGKLMWKKRMPLAIILVSFLVPRYALYCSSSFGITSLVFELKGILETSETIDLEFITRIVLEGLKKFFLSEVGASLAFLLSALLSLTVICTVEIGLKVKEMTLKNLMLEIWKTLKGVMATKIYISFLLSGYYGFWSLLILGIIVVGDLSVGSFFLASLMDILSLLLLVYLEFVWFQGVVVSVMESGCNGLAALGKAADLIKGRRALAFRVNFLMGLLISFVGLLNLFTESHPVKSGIGFMVLSFIIHGINFAMQVFMLVVSTVFYQECSSKGWTS